MTRFAPGLSQGQKTALRLSTVEYQAKSLTRKQVDALRRIRDRGPEAGCDGYGRAGGAVGRMFVRLAGLVLCTQAPYTITVFGRNVLDEIERA
jgi:hypothetical protein